MKRIMVICMFAVLLAGCDVSQHDTQQDTQQDTQNVNGRLYVWPQGTVSIIDDYDHLWYPLNLSDNFNTSGMRVRCDLKPEPVSSRNPSFEEGWPVQIIWIEEIK